MYYPLLIKIASQNSCLFEVCLIVFCLIVFKLTLLSAEMFLFPLNLVCALVSVCLVVQVTCHILEPLAYWKYHHYKTFVDQLHHACFTFDIAINMVSLLT